VVLVHGWAQSGAAWDLPDFRTYAVDLRGHGESDDFGDYLRAHGTGNVTALVLVGAITEIGRGRPGGETGPLMRAALPAAITDDAVLADFCRAMAPGLPGETVDKLTATAVGTSHKVRGELFRRDVGSADVLRAVDVPALVVHGTQDRVVAPAAAEYSAALIPGAELSWYPDTAHVPFLEQREQFATDLGKVVR
jgi:pimeloyl-ACP methyl ester carboxylesterase